LHALRPASVAFGSERARIWHRPNQQHNCPNRNHPRDHIRARRRPPPGIPAAPACHDDSPSGMEPITRGAAHLCPQTVLQTAVYGNPMYPLKRKLHIATRPARSIPAAHACRRRSPSRGALRIQRFLSHHPRNKSPQAGPQTDRCRHSPRRRRCRNRRSARGRPGPSRLGHRRCNRSPPRRDRYRRSQQRRRS
jgi:hypothetical protein